ncbi:acyl-CoA carboxylase subunit epsilon [Kibdelosporangium lantanae]|uniref:Acyl-CoA carboxylase subunit epsilon n=1 Tax=Kibdelosporangium lantanae TaxID=1497396 RepID=A0ABW3MDJ8_9PSEU
MSDRPLLRIVKGDPTDAELAALTVVLATLSAPVADEPPQRSR